MNGKQPWPKADVFSQGIFAALPESEWGPQSSFPPPVVYERKTPLFLEGQRASDVYLIGGGLIKTYKNPSHNRVQIIGILGAGDVVGTEALTRGLYNQSASVLLRSLVFKCNKEFFLEFIARKPEVSLTLIQMLNREFGNIQSLICDLGTKKALARVASCLLLIMEKQVEPSETRVFNLPISRQEMGALLGLSPETVSRQLKDLTSSKVIRLEHKRMTILKLDRLKAIAQA